MDTAKKCEVRGNNSIMLRRAFNTMPTNVCRIADDASSTHQRSSPRNGPRYFEVSVGIRRNSGPAKPYESLYEIATSQELHVFPSENRKILNYRTFAKKKNQKKRHNSVPKKDFLLKSKFWGPRSVVDLSSELRRTVDDISTSVRRTGVECSSTPRRHQRTNYHSFC